MAAVNQDYTSPERQDAFSKLVEELRALAAFVCDEPHHVSRGQSGLPLPIIRSPCPYHRRIKKKGRPLRFLCWRRAVCITLEDAVVPAVLYI